MLLSKLIENLERQSVFNFTDCEIGHIATDTADIKDGTLFICIDGVNIDGHIFAAEAVKKGAVCIVTEKQVNVEVCQIIVEDTRKAVSVLAYNFFERAIDKMKLVCVVGTCGKTSTAFIIDSILREAGFKTGVISTNGVYINKNFFENNMTTPDSITLNGWFAKMYKQGVEFVVMELSAHAIAQHRLHGIKADLTVFTNFSQDHLDYFKDMETYRKCKKDFFKKEFTRIAVVNSDDELGREIIFAQDVPLVSYGLENPADVFAIDVDCEGTAASYILNIYDEVLRIKYYLNGMFNVYNTLAAATACRIFGIKSQIISQGISKLKFIEGRNQTFFFPKGFRVVVDYAHTPESISNILSHLRSSTEGKLITVFGCGGNRDRSKRAIMAQNVSKYSDYAIITTDNSRFEDPFEIMFEVQKGLSINHELVKDRQQAIIKAVGMAERYDTIAVLGKGHEKYQEVAGQKLPFSDLAVVQEILSSYSRR